MNRLKRKFKVQPGPTKPNATDARWDETYNAAQLFDPSSDTLCADPAQIQPLYSHLQPPIHTFSGPPGQGFYYPQQQSVVYVPMPMNPIASPTTVAFQPTSLARPVLNPIDTSYQTSNGGNAPPTPQYPGVHPHHNQDEYMHPRRSTSTSAGHHDMPARPPSAAGQRFPQPYPLSPVSANASLLRSDLDSLKRYDLVFLVSDSPSMGQNGKWQKCGELLAQLTRVAMQYDNDGVEIHFLNNDDERSEQNFSSEEDVETLFHSVVSPEGSSRLTDKLDLLVSEYCMQLKKYIDGNPAKPWRSRPVPKKAIYVVLTDGNHADMRKIVDVLSDMAGFLKSNQAPSTQFGIEFVQIEDGNDLEWLHRARYQNEKIRAITAIDTYVGGTLDDIQVGTMLLRPVSGENN